MWHVGLTYHGKAADTWAVGITLYCMVVGKYPFLGETLQDTYDKAWTLILFMFSLKNNLYTSIFRMLFTLARYVITNYAPSDCK